MFKIFIFIIGLSITNLSLFYKMGFSHHNYASVTFTFLSTGHEKKNTNKKLQYIYNGTQCEALVFNEKTSLIL